MPQRICYLDAFSGIAGDMLVGALAGAGASQDAIADAVHSLGTGASVSFEAVKRRGIGATKFHVEGGEQKAHRHLPQILRMIDASSLPERAKQNATAVFRKLAEAEASVHQVPMEKVHFHEVGAFDSIADIVGACLGFELLGVQSIACSPLNVGGGTVQTEHGILPVPAPATAALLKGLPVYSSGAQMELTTPTGAAVVAALASSVGPMRPMKIVAAGHGAGTRDFAEQSNVLRVLIGESSDAAEAVEIDILETNIDDSNPQVLAYAMDRLMDAGALDVSLQSIQMKKGRPGQLLKVLAKPEDRETMAKILFAETSTLGLRIYRAERRVQERHWEQVATRYGTVRVKVSGDGAFNPEYEDCRRLAAESGAPLKDILTEASFEYWKTKR